MCICDCSDKWWITQVILIYYVEDFNDETFINHCQGAMNTFLDHDQLTREATVPALTAPLYRVIYFLVTKSNRVSVRALSPRLRQIVICDREILMKGTAKEMRCFSLLSAVLEGSMTGYLTIERMAQVTIVFKSSWTTASLRQ
ncbi:hypothetical protein CEXT_176281 [Caerostris extrusa]|uniref:Uncharacterized protein n=1 Tax=Caerostris extrusa TaxID=172846 RepID=A0AAV4NSL9_CAEEX|nr:hypothetical protein CEXT_176281 [Caerostris extrusa]